MTASNLTAEQVLDKAIAWLFDDGKINTDTANRLRQHCLPAETDKQKALRLLQMYGCADILRLSVDQVKLIRSVVERCPDSSPDPAPSKPKLAVGQIWRRRDGAIVTIDRFHRAYEEDDRPFRADGDWYTDEGCHFSHKSISTLDLVEYLGHVNPKSCEH